MDNSINSSLFSFNEYKANQTMSLYGSSNKVDFSFVNNSDKTNTTEDTTDTTKAQPTKVKNSSDLLQEIKQSRSDNVSFSSTLSGYSALTKKADISDNSDAQQGAKTLLNVVSTTGGKSGLDDFTSSASTLSSNDLNKLFTQTNDISSLGSTISDVANYATAALNIDKLSSSEGLNSFFESVDSIKSMDFTAKAAADYSGNGENKLTSDYKIETFNSFVDAVNKISDSGLTDSEKSEGINDLFEKVENSSADTIQDQISSSLSNTLE